MANGRTGTPINFHQFEFGVVRALLFLPTTPPSHPIISKTDLRFVFTGPSSLRLHRFCFFLSGEMNNAEREEGEVWYEEHDQGRGVDQDTDFSYLVTLAFFRSFLHAMLGFFFIALFDLGR